MTVVEAPAPPRARIVSLDRVRGLAVACMVVDHLVLLTDGPMAVRYTVGRLAMPLFFVLAGLLVTRLSERLLLVAGAGVLLPLVVPWVDAPNVLLWYAVGAVVLVLWRRLGWPLWLLVVVPLALAANGYDVEAGTGYQLPAMVGLMALGSMLGTRSMAWGDRLPSVLAAAGRYPLTVYVGHVLALEGLRRVLS